MKQHARLSIAPMMDWTDRHCRYLHRLMSREALLYTEMVTAPAILHGDRDRLLAFDPAEHPVALQLGGSDPSELANATEIAVGYGYDEINLNIGCPSDRVQSGCFGAVLMERPKLVADCVAAMIAASPVEVTVKCRIGVDDQVPEEVLPTFLETVAAAGVGRFAIHARKAWLQGLSPKENRDVPPLNYPLVYQMKRDFPELHLSINGGVMSLDEAQAHLAEGMDGVMIGRAAYHDPSNILLAADQKIFGLDCEPRSAEEIVGLMLPYIAAHVANGGKLAHVTRHMLGLFAGRPGARGWKRVLSERAHRPGAGVEVVEAALSEIVLRAA
ncbi:tRNA dihydrouridine(20/20a) synthase DusA [Roseobacter sp. HKCCD9010]|uniref:tRNA dihydrouridine(20/20a) synthase DusA n=1 Tax=unclassified Roseobacter TaxID=196798 RepID=UPI0014929988|nr:MULTISPECIES: tRNA dihydrouridine(20/20a) synthase DusA [unclassified Roseobacter]MBF9050419.1 tRNA dihydrouridine(20/20a) synthase DusA [Rhodobacterales bacterium HKCCD4356]NNV12164.1 tRNA dihydrouridine(20/20a) synthase DusA [Roseobacter sp. HKCCD7357]NNV17178.1 tRNA dihydrouridine(20/20a) synthase DusA [Roseobacter sp. HKCCD8768]NNV26407.1 tRNA dihydrouridine(20/20a) synthase DusA [Roseobacter sp. HKCCD8192]NNV30902.1 tRNA dihydrouridine(20/20a) synthase DusA [Roseobacter sp. HKCCD9061]